MPICRICKQNLNLNKDEWCKPVTNYYYHKNWYEEWKSGKDNSKTQADGVFWYEAIVDFLYQERKMSVDFAKMKSQWENFLKSGKYTPKGIYFALRYFYEVQKGDEKKAQGGIGIVPSVYQDSARYWIEREKQKEGTLEAIIKQMSERQNRTSKIIDKNKQKKVKAKWNIDNI